MTEKVSVSVVLPTYNEKGNIEGLSKELISELKANGYTSEIIIVDDNSPDGTGKVATELSDKNKEVKAIVRTNERGLATAILRGIEESKGSIIVLMDCDFSHPPKFVPIMVKELANADAVFASRYVRGGKMNTDPVQYFLSLLFNYTIKILIGTQVIDTTNGFFAIKKSALDGLLNRKVFSGYGDYCFKMLYYLKPKKLKIKEIPFHYMPRRYGSSKTSLVKAGISYSLEALKLRLRL